MDNFPSLSSLVCIRRRRGRSRGVEVGFGNCSAGFAFPDAAPHTTIHYHRIYYTPVKLFCWGQRDSPLCPRCKVMDGTLMHMPYWASVFSSVNAVYQLTLPVCPKIGLLGIIPESHIDPLRQVFLTPVLCLARKLLAAQWLSLTPSQSQWITSANGLLEREKIVYQHTVSVQNLGNVDDMVSISESGTPPQAERLLNTHC